MQSKKRTKVTDSSGWTHIVYGPSNAVNTKHTSADPLDFQSLESLSLEQVLEDHARLSKSWEKSDCWKTLSAFIQNTIVNRKDIRITNCVCLGLGSVSAGRVSSKCELAALVAILCLLSETHSIKTVVFQDPAFNDVDEAFFTKLGYSVVHTPLGFNTITHETFCFAPHLENEIFAMALRNVHPALCIGNSEPLKDKPLHSSAAFSKDMTEIFSQFNETTNSREMPEYDQDSWCQFTSIYWRCENTK